MPAAHPKPAERQPLSRRSKPFNRLELTIMILAATAAAIGAFLLVSEMGDRRIPLAVIAAVCAWILALEAAICALGGRSVMRTLEPPRKERDDEAWLNDMVNAGFTREQALLIRKRPG